MSFIDGHWLLKSTSAGHDQNTRCHIIHEHTAPHTRHEHGQTIRSTSTNGPSNPTTTAIARTSITPLLPSDPRARPVDPRARDPRAAAAPPNFPSPPMMQPPPQMHAQPPHGVAGLDPNLVQQVMALTPAQIAQLPPDKQQSILALRQQITGGM